MGICRDSEYKPLQCSRRPKTASKRNESASDGSLSRVIIRFIAMRGNSIQQSIFWVSATDSTVLHLTSVLNGSRNTTARSSHAMLRQKSGNAVLASSSIIATSRLGWSFRKSRKDAALPGSISMKTSLSKGLSSTSSAIAAEPFANSWNSP